jgi:hypothetical protein
LYNTIDKMDTAAWLRVIAFMLVAGWLSYFVPSLLQLLNPVLIAIVYIVGFWHGTRAGGVDMSALPDVQRARAKSTGTAFGMFTQQAKTEGWLFKRSSNSKWKRRYVRVLGVTRTEWQGNVKNPCLDFHLQFFASSQTNGAAKGSILISGSQILRSVDAGVPDKFVFSVHSQQNSQFVSLAAESQGEMEQWVASLCNVADGDVNRQVGNQTKALGVANSGVATPSKEGGAAAVGNSVDGVSNENRDGTADPRLWDVQPLVKAEYPATMFVIHRSMNRNTVVYAANVLGDGTLDPAMPVKVFWVMAERSNGQIAAAETEGLTLLERKTAYGVNHKPIPGQPGKYEISLHSIRDRTMIIAQQEQPDGSFTIRMTSSIGQHTDAEIKRVFIQCKTIFHVPKVQYVEIFGHTSTGEDAYEKIVP